MKPPTLFILQPLWNMDWPLLKSFPILFSLEILMLHATCVTPLSGCLIWSNAKPPSRSVTITITDVLYVPDLWLNLFSITKAIRHDTVKLGSSPGKMPLTIGPHQMQMIFDQVYPTGSGRILGISILPYSTEAVHLTATPIPLSSFHEQQGHPNYQVCKATATSFGLHTSGNPFPCVHCALSKSKKSKIPNFLMNHAASKGERLALDISYPNYTSFGDVNIGYSFKMNLLVTSGAFS
jgi:hypothetical protein